MEVNEKRRNAVEKARRAWIKKLIDLSRRNNLLYYRPLKWGTLSLSFEDTDRLASLLRGDSVPLKTLVVGLSDEDLMAKVLSIWRRSQANQEEKGLATMFVALGMAGWEAADGGRNPDSPVLLLPVALELKGRSGVAVSVHRVGPTQANLVLTHVLQQEYGLSISSDQLLPLLEGHDDEEAFDPALLYRVLKETCKSIPDFAIKETAVLGNFAFQKMAMVRDLQDNLDRLVSSDLIAALAGDVQAKELIGAGAVDADPKEFDHIPPQSEFLVLDADSSQQSAIAAALRGQSTVVHGPPGTGKSQTIANVIASLTAAGKTVLFVAEKRAALEAVLKRLRQVRLEKLAVDLHGADVSAKHVMGQVAAALDAVRQPVPIACNEMHQRYVERRDRLNRHVENLHKPRTPGGLSVFELQGTLLHLQAQVRTETRWRKADLSRIETSGPAKVRDLLREAEGFALLFLRRDSSPWNGVELTDGPAAEEAVDVAAALSSCTWPDFMASLSGVANTTGFPMPGSLKEAREVYALLDDVGRTLEHYSPDIFKQN
ncbi:MAG: DUF4011 domain-containing protein, partial [Acidobacteriota bacterium]|nr:DUF4011 domain-containing protein [Acidobacteriota bacterium]